MEDVYQQARKYPNLKITSYAENVALSVLSFWETNPKKIAENFKEVKNDNINLWSPSVVETSATVKNQP